MKACLIALMPFVAATGCSTRSALPDGAILLEESVALTREGTTDTAHREIEVDGDSVIVAFVDEGLTDVTPRLDLRGASGAAAAVSVENHLEGAGIEVAALAAPRGSRVRLTVTGPQDANVPGHVTVRIRRYDAGTRRFAGALAAFRAWSAATDAAHRASAIRRSGLADIDRAIAGLDAAGERALAAEARLVKANMLAFFRLDLRESRAEAGRAREAFAALGDAHPTKVARAQFVEAAALAQLARDRAAVNPTSSEAMAEARKLLASLAAAGSAFGPIERARAIDAIGYLDIIESKLVDADRRFEEAKALYQSTGYLAGVVEMLANQVEVVAESGRRTEAAKAYGPVIAGLEKISNPAKKAAILLAAAGAEVFTGSPDLGAEHLRQVIAIAHEHELRGVESEALHTLGHLYWYRGDSLQGRAFAAESLRIAREAADGLGVAYGLQSTGIFARIEGDVTTAIAMHEEAIERASHVVLRMRTMRHLALDYLAIDQPARAIAELRRSLAVDLGDPNHYAYADVRRDLAESLLEHGDGSRATREESAQLLATALRQARQVKDMPGEIGARRVTATLRIRQGRPAEAEAEFERVFALIREYRGTTANPQFRLATLDHEQAAFRAYFDFMMRDVADGAASRRSTAREEAALRTLELARESHFGATRSEAMDARTLARIDALYSEMAQKSVRMAALLRQRPDPKQAAAIEALQLEMSRLRLDVDRERTAAAMSRVADRSARTVRTWRPVGPRTVQLSYALGNRRAYVWARSAAGTRVAALSVSPDALERSLIELSALDRQKQPREVERALALLSSVLLSGDLLEDSDTVEVIAEGRIASVPFAGLRSPRDPARKLVETHAVTMITSMFAVDEPVPAKVGRPFALVALASGAGTLRSAVLTDPVPRLQAATSEINAVARLFQARDRAARIRLFANREGTAEELRAIWSSGADVVHFATHALADLRQPLASLLVLPAESVAGTPTYLTAGQVQDWRGDADLVFLSACESAIGPPRFAGGMPGLQSAFLRAGARGVIATLWPIEDVLAREFSEDFYERYTAGKSAVQALGETQREWLEARAGLGEAESARRRLTALAHGYYAH